MALRLFQPPVAEPALVKRKALRRFLELPIELE